jgi:outer membrane protein assembly factor BamB
MRSWTWPAIVLSLTGIAFSALAPLVSADEPASELEQWPQWRGPLATGVAPLADPPIEWSETKNLHWKAALPGEGHSTPVVWQDLVFLTAAVPVGEPLAPRYDDAPGAHDSRPVTKKHDFVVVAFDRQSGEIRWQTRVRSDVPHEGGHVTASLASNSPVTDGEAVYAFFGSRGLHALDMKGRILWQRDFGPMQTKHAHGEGASPTLWKDTLVVNWDHRGQSFVVAVDRKTGKDKWRRERNEVTSWSTPIVVTSTARPQVVVSGTERIRAYDLEDGTVIWECGGLSANVVASPVAGDGLLFAASSYDTRALLAIRLEGAKGDLTGTDAVVWSRTRGTPYVPSPLLYDGALYFLRHYQPILTRVQAATGNDQPGPIRLDGLRDIYASPVAAAGRIYVTDRHGATMVISAGEKPELLASNQLQDRFSASAVLVGNQLLLRGERYLYSLRKGKSDD